MKSSVVNLITFVLFVSLAMVHSFMGEVAQTVFCMGMAVIVNRNMRGDTA